jgi:hypothetical protein
MICYAKPKEQSVIFIIGRPKHFVVVVVVVVVVVIIDII